MQGKLHHARHDHAGGRADADTSSVVDRLAVQRVVHRLAHPLVVPRRLRVPLVGELDPEDRGVLRGYHLDAGVLLETLGVGAIERDGDVGLAALQHHGARRGLGDAPHDERLHVGDAAPVARVGLEDDFHAGLVVHELVGARADRVLPEAFVAHLGQVFLGHDDSGSGGRCPIERHEVWPRLLEMEAHEERSDDLDVRDVFLKSRRASALVPLEAELHVIGRHGVAVVELQPGAQLELVGPAVRALLPRLGDARAHLLAWIRTNERVVDRVEDPERRDLRRSGGGVEPRRGDRHVPGHGRPSRRRLLRGDRRRRSGDDHDGDEQRQAEAVSHESLRFEPAFTSAAAP